MFKLLYKKVLFLIQKLHTNLIKLVIYTTQLALQDVVSLVQGAVPVDKRALLLLSYWLLLHNELDSWTSVLHNKLRGSKRNSPSMEKINSGKT